ncbi:MAG: hypothetical protein JWO58_1116 [Chitinophagaceae bacterium]|nr:hypothetical protein [Chitinophagaceae bacterium]
MFGHSSVFSVYFYLLLHMYNKLKTTVTSNIISPIEKNEKGLRLASGILGYVFFAVFFVIAWVYYKERMLPFDGAFQCFKLIDTQAFNIEAGRFGVLLTQVLPFLALKVGATLETVLRLFSLSFIAIQFIIFLILFNKLKDYRSVLILLLSLCLAYRYQFYYTVSEIHQTIAPVVLIFALFNSPLLFSSQTKDKLICFISIVILCWWISNIHILSIVLLTFVVVYTVISNVKLLFQKWFWFLIAGGYSFFIYKIFTVEEGSYEASKMITADKLKMTLIDLAQIPAFQFFKEEFFRSYYILVFAALILFGIYIYKKKWIPFTYMCLSLIGFLFLIIAYNITPDSPIVYQNYYACFGLLIAVPLCMELVELFQVKIVFVLVGVLLALSTFKIIQCARIYEFRMEYFSRVEQNVKGLPERKFMISADNVNWQMIWTDWDMGFETLLHSAIQSPDSAMTFTIVSKYSDYDSMMYKPNTFIGVAFSPYWFTSQNMSQTYFRIQNTPYRILNNIPLDSNANSKFSAADVKLAFQKSDLSLPYFGYHILPVTIRNQSNDTLYSKTREQDQLILGYHLYDDKGNLQDSVKVGSPLEMDVYPHTEKTVGIELKHLKRGSYTLVADLIYGRQKWLNLNATSKVVIH